MWNTSSFLIKNNRISIVTIFILLCVIFILLFHSDDRIIKRLPKNYFLLASEEANGVALVIDFRNELYVEVIPPPILKVGFDNDYIIAQTMDINGEIFYIIPLKNPMNKSPDLNRIGPLSKLQFNEKIQILKISQQIKMVSISELK